MAVLWTTRRIVPAAPAASPPSDLAQRMAAVAASPTPATAMQQPRPVQAAPAQTQGGPVKLANLTTLYSDKLTDGRQ
jgi:hypothetical protein